MVTIYQSIGFYQIFTDFKNKNVIIVIELCIKYIYHYRRTIVADQRFPNSLGGTKKF